MTIQEKHVTVLKIDMGMRDPPASPGHVTKKATGKYTLQNSNEFEWIP